MKNKKLNIFLLLCMLLFLTINTFSIGVNDNTNTVTRAEFNQKISTLEDRMTQLENSLDLKISTYLQSMPLMFEGSKQIQITKNQTNNLWTISYISVISGLATMGGTTLGSVSGIISGGKFTFTSNFNWDVTWAGNGRVDGIILIAFSELMGAHAESTFPATITVTLKSNGQQYIHAWTYTTADQSVVLRTNTTYAQGVAWNFQAVTSGIELDLY